MDVAGARGRTPQEITSCVFEMTGVSDVRNSVSGGPSRIAPAADVCLMFDLAVEFSTSNPLRPSGADARNWWNTKPDLRRADRLRPHRQNTCSRRIQCLALLVSQETNAPDSPECARDVHERDPGKRRAGWEALRDVREIPPGWKGPGPCPPQPPGGSLTKTPLSAKDTARSAGAPACLPLRPGSGVKRNPSPTTRIESRAH